MENEMLGVTL